MSTPQLGLFDAENREEFRGSKPVPNRSEPVEKDRFRTPSEKSSSETAEITNGFAVPNRLPDSSMVSRFQDSPLRGNTNPGTGLAEQDPQAGKRVIATLSLPADPGVRGQVPNTAATSPGSEPGTAGTAPTLRPYQTAAIEAVGRELATHRSTLLVLPTGCGKTVVFAEIARVDALAGSRTLVLAHRTELLDQAARKLTDVGVTSSIDQGQRIGSRWSQVVVGSVQTLRGARLQRYPRDFFGKIVVDEAHHAAAKSYGNILEYFTGAKILGVTATPDRGDGKGLGKIFETLAFTYEMRKAIADGFLSPLRAKRVLVDDIDLSAVKNRAGDFAQDELSKILNEDTAVHGVVNPLLEMAGDRRTLIFGVDVAHAKAIAQFINRKKPGAAMALDGTANAIERAAVLELFRRGKFQYLANCALFTEGFDEPSIQCVALARPTQSRALYTQMLGRGTRLHPGKADCLVLDFVGNSGKHRLIGPADALAGRDLDERTREIIEKDLDGQTELEEVLAHAEEEAKKRRQTVNLVALTVYREREVDLFLGDHMPTWDPNGPAAKLPATPAQLARLLELKLAPPPFGFSKAEASAVIEAAEARRRTGLCSVAQARLLEKYGFPAATLTFARARELIGQLVAQKAWRMPWKLGAPEYKPKRRA